MQNFTDNLSNVWKYFSVPLFEIGTHKLTLMSILTALFIFTIVLKLSRLGEKLTKSLLKKYSHLDNGVKDSIATFVRYTILVIGCLITLDTIGISMSSLAAVGAVLMVGIGFGLQNITQNFISGLIILLERPIKVGDLIEVGGVNGRIIEIGARSTQIHTRDDVAIIIPNSQFISEQVVNQSYSGEIIRLKISVGVSYNSDPKEVEKVLLEVAKTHSKVIQSPAPGVFFKDFADSSLNFDLTIWTRDLWFDEKIKSDIRYKIFEAFQQNNISIPFPQMDVHVNPNEKKV